MFLKPVSSRKPDPDPALYWRWPVDTLNRSTFGYLTDVFCAAEHRGRVWAMAGQLRVSPTARSCRGFARWMLATEDAKIYPAMAFQRLRRLRHDHARSSNAGRLQARLHAACRTMTPSRAWG